ncbi:MAG: hypothetical protein ACI9G1_002374 [Pirellulaceae bacterium]|jgi:hypothetical protein
MSRLHFAFDIASCGQPNKRSLVETPVSFSQFLQTTEAQLVLGIAILCAMISVGYRIAISYRDQINDDRPSVSDTMTNFHEMLEEGDIEDSEYRTIKTVLGEKLKTELNDDNEEG